jgi:6-phosphogluconolactonase
MTTNRIRRLSLRSTFAFALLPLLLGVSAQKNWAQGESPSEGHPGAVYTLTNQPSGNSVIVFDRAADGTLMLAGSYPTGGTGTGAGSTFPTMVDPLGGQGAVVLSRSNRVLFAVSAASNQVSAFAVDGDRLDLLNTISSGGTMPVSVAVYGNLVYVLNAGGTPNITGFTIDPRTNKLVPLAGSARPLAGGSAANPAEVSFSLDGSVLMVTEKGPAAPVPGFLLGLTHTIDTYTVNRNGTVSGPISNHSSGSTPFGFEFTHRGLAIVSEAGPPLSPVGPNALSSYRVDENGKLELITGSLNNGQAATCWAIVTSDGRYAYSINTGSGTISSYEVSPEGHLTLLDPTAASPGSGSTPTDPALSNDGRFLYVRDPLLNTVDAFRVEANGSLTPLGTTKGVPTGGQGLAAR